MANLKALVSSSSGLVRGVFQTPLNFSVSGHYVIDMPHEMTGFLDTNVVGDLVNLKIQGFQGIFTSPALNHVLYDEFLTSANVDTANSSLVYTGVNKRTVILPGGTLLTNPLTIMTPTANVWLHWSGFQLYRYPGDPTNPAVAANPPPSQMLYSYDASLGFVDFDPTAFTASICNPGSPFTTILSPTFETVTAASLPASVRLKFVNNASKPMHMSDFYLLYG